MLRHIAPLVLAQLASSSLLHQPALKQMIRPWCLNSHFVLRLEMVQNTMPKENRRIHKIFLIFLCENSSKLHKMATCPLSSLDLSLYSPWQRGGGPAACEFSCFPFWWVYSQATQLHLLVPKLKRNELQVCKFLRNTSRFAKTLCHLAIRYGG